MKEVLDIRFNGKLNPDLSLLFNKISYEKREEFNKLVASISRPNINNLDWWVQGPASRNTYSSPLFHYYCILFLLNHLIKEKNFSFEAIIFLEYVLTEFRRGPGRGTEDKIPVP